jgi:hypothetical protein
MFLSSKTVWITRQTAIDVFLRWLVPIGLGIVIGFLVLVDAWYYAIGVVIVTPVVIAVISRPIIGVFIWLLLMPYISVFPNPELAYWLVHRILILLALFLAIIVRRQTRETGLLVRLKPPDAAVLTLLGFGTILIFAFQANLDILLIHYIDRFLLPLFVYLIVRLDPLDAHDLKLLQWTVFIIAISQGIIGVMSILMPGLLPNALRPYRNGYADGTLDNPNVFAIALVFCGLLLFQWAMDRKSGWGWSLILLVCGLCTVGIFFSMERAAWLAGVLILLGLLCLYPKAMMRILLVSGIVLIVLLQAGLLSKYIVSASNRLIHGQPVYDRIVVTDAMIQMALKKPLFGWGYESLNENITQYYRQLGNARIALGLVTSHNTYLTILTEQGLIILFLFLFPAIWLLAKTGRNWSRLPNTGSWNRSMLVVLWLVAMGYFVITNFLDMRWFPYGVGLWWITLGLIANIVAPMMIPSGLMVGLRSNKSNRDDLYLDRDLCLGNQRDAR